MRSTKQAAQMHTKSFSQSNLILGCHFAFLFPLRASSEYLAYKNSALIVFRLRNMGPLKVLNDTKFIL